MQKCKISIRNCLVLQYVRGREKKKGIVKNLHNLIYKVSDQMFAKHSFADN